MIRTKGLALTAVLLAAAGAPSATAQGAPLAALDSLRALGLDSIPGAATVFFRPSERDRAAQLRLELEGGLSYFRRTLGLARPLRLAVLQPGDWSRLSPLPYGFPNNIGPPANLILAPARRPHPDPGLEDAQSDLLLLFHEGGHLLTFELVGPETDSAYHARLDSIPEWYWEFAASAFLTSYLRAQRPADATALVRYFQRLASGPAPQFVHLDAWFQAMMGHSTADGTPYLRTAEGRRNFGWYQGVVGLLGTYVPASREPALFRQIRLVGHGAHTPTTRELVEQLDTLAPGLIRRLEGAGAGWR